MNVVTLNTDTIIFVSCVSTLVSIRSVGFFTAPQDIIALAVQGLGGGIASGSQTSNSQATLVRVLLSEESTIDSTYAGMTGR